jgi:3-oxoacyl-[acyl-carrier protein] reductase
LLETLSASDDNLRLSMSDPNQRLPYDLNGHVAIVTGANHGIGAATAKMLAACGSAVLLTYLRTSDPQEFPETYRSNRAQDAREVLADIRAFGGNAADLEADLGDASVIPELFDLAEAELGPVDILVNNATSWTANTFSTTEVHLTGVSLEGVSAATHDHVFKVDARAGALLIAEFSRRHITLGANWGRIIGLTSGGPSGFPSEVSYGAAKAALENYTMSAAFELAQHGVTANIVYPPVTDTGWVTDGVRQHVANTADLIHIVDPYEIANIIAFLCSDQAWLITANRIHLR